MPFKTNTFDLVVSTEVLEHVVNPLKVIKEIKRILKKNGFLIIELDTGNWLFKILWFFWEHFGNGRVWRNAHLHQFNKRKLVQIIKANDLQILNIKTHHLGMAVTILCQKK